MFIELTKIRASRDPSTAKALFRRLYRESSRCGERFNDIVPIIQSFTHDMFKMSQTKRGDKIFNIIPPLEGALSKLTPYNGTVYTPTKSKSDKSTGDVVISVPIFCNSHIQPESITLGSLNIVAHSRSRTARCIITEGIACFGFHSIQRFFERAPDNTVQSLFKCLKEVDDFLTCVYPPQDLNQDIYLPCSEGMFIAIRQHDTITSMETRNMLGLNTQHLKCVTFISNDTIRSLQSHQLRQMKAAGLPHLEECTDFFQQELLNNYVTRHHFETPWAGMVLKTRIARNLGHCVMRKDIEHFGTFNI